MSTRAPRPGSPLVPGSLRSRMLAHFEQDGEQLTAREAAKKFGCTLRHASVTLSLLKAEGAVENAMVWRRSTPA